MTSSEQEFMFYLKYFHKNSIVPLKKGNNIILSNYFPELSEDNIILFNLNILSENEVMLRTFDYFPLMLNFNQDQFSSSFSDAGIGKELLVRKQTIIYINSLLNIQIFPLFTNNSSIQNNFFFFEKFDKYKHNLISLCLREDSSKNIIFHHERKYEINEILVNGKNDGNIMNIFEEQSFPNNNLKNHFRGKINLNSAIETKNVKLDRKSLNNLCNFSNNINMEIKNFEDSDKNFKMRKDEGGENDSKIDLDILIDKKVTSDKSQISRDNGVNFNHQIINIHQEDDLIDIKKVSEDSESELIQKPCMIEFSNNLSSDHSSGTVNKYNENNLIQSYKNESDAYNILYNKIEESILPRKILVIDDDENLKDEIKMGVNSIETLDTLNKSLIAPRQTRSSSKSISNSNLELLQKKRRRRGNKSISNFNLNKENSITQTITNNLDVNNNSRNRECNVNVNETVNKNLIKLYESITSIEKEINEVKNENIDVIKTDYIKDNVKIIPSPNSNRTSNNIKQKCTICLDTIKNISRLDKCEHEFCKECIDQWAILSNECPLCKIEFKKIIYWDSVSKQERKVKKRKFKYEEEDEEPWLRNCAENCMVCNKNNDEHLLLVCDKCAYNICHTYCAGLDLIPDDEWLCIECTNRRRPRVSKRNSSKSLNNYTDVNVIDNNYTFTKRKTIIVDDDCEDAKLKKNYSIKSNSSNSIKNKNSKNINIPISYKLKKHEVSRKSLNLNLNLNLEITNSQERNSRGHMHKMVKKSLSTKIQNNRSKYINQNERIRTRRKYNLRRKK